MKERNDDDGLAAAERGDVPALLALARKQTMKVPICGHSKKHDGSLCENEAKYVLAVVLRSRLIDRVMFVAFGGVCAECYPCASTDGSKWPTPATVYGEPLVLS